MVGLVSGGGRILPERNPDVPHVYATGEEPHIFGRAPAAPSGEQSVVGVQQLFRIHHKRRRIAVLQHFKYPCLAVAGVC